MNSAFQRLRALEQFVAKVRRAVTRLARLRLLVAAHGNEVEQRHPEIVATIAGGAVPHDALAP